MVALLRYQQIWLLWFQEMEIAGPMFVERWLMIMMILQMIKKMWHYLSVQNLVVEAKIMAGSETIMNCRNDILTQSRIRKFREKATFCPQRWFPVPATAIFICTHSNFETCNLSHSYVTSSTFTMDMFPDFPWAPNPLLFMFNLVWGWLESPFQS